MLQIHDDLKFTNRMFVLTQIDILIRSCRPKMADAHGTSQYRVKSNVVEARLLDFPDYQSMSHICMHPDQLHSSRCLHEKKKLDVEKQERYPRCWMFNCLIIRTKCTSKG